MAIDEHHIEYLSEHIHGRLATIAADGTPQNKPVGYRYNAALGTIDIAGYGMESSAKYRNIARHPDVSFVVDDITGEGIEGVRFVELRGEAEQAHVPVADPTSGLSPEIIRIYPRRLVSFNIEPDHSGMYALDLAAGNLLPAPADRPALDPRGTPAAATHAVERLVAELQEGLDQGDPDIYNRHFAADVIWGSPFGATVAGYEQLHAIHTMLMQRAVGGSASRIEIVHTVSPAPGVVLAQARRIALDEEGNPLPEPDEGAHGAFSETVLYVLVRRHGTWWLAAGQNTIFQPSAGPLQRGSPPPGGAPNPGT